MRFDTRGEYFRIIACTFGLPLLCAGSIFALWRWRSFLEPMVRVVDWFVMSRRHAIYEYDPGRYWLYGAILAGTGVAMLFLGVWALRDKPKSDRRLETYLEQKMVAQDSEHRRSL